MPEVAVITPTWGEKRHGVLLGRCIPSVRNQTFRDVEHLVVSDGPDYALSQAIQNTGVRYLELADHVEPHSWGAGARNHGLTHTDAAFIAYLDSDNSFRSEHLALLVKALKDSGADFAYSRMQIAGGGEVGSAPPALGHIDTSLIVHRRSSVKVFGEWLVAPIYEIDWNFVSRWVALGARWVFVPTITVDYYRLH